jgi:hypothetical protein
MEAAASFVLDTKEYTSSEQSFITLLYFVCLFANAPTSSDWPSLITATEKVSITFCLIIVGPCPSKMLQSFQ